MKPELWLETLIRSGNLNLKLLPFFEAVILFWSPNLISYHFIYYFEELFIPNSILHDDKLYVVSYTNEGLPP